MIHIIFTVIIVIIVIAANAIVCVIVVITIMSNILINIMIAETQSYANLPVLFREGTSGYPLGTLEESSRSPLGIV